MAQLVVSIHDRELQRFPLQSTLTMIGRDITADLVIDNLAVSRMHARIEFDGRDFCIADCGSRNGLSVNGERTKFQRLSEGDVIGVNKFLIRFSLAGGVPPGALRPPDASNAGPPRDSQRTMDLGFDTGARMSAQVKREIVNQRARRAVAHGAVRRGETVPDALLVRPERQRRSSSTKVFLGGMAAGVAVIAIVVALGVI